MKKIIDTLRKVGVIHSSKGDYITGAFDDRSDLKDHAQKEVGSGKNGEADPSQKSHPVRSLIVVIIALFFFFVLWGSGVTVWSLLGMAMWGYLLYWLFGDGKGASVGKVVGMTCVAIIVSIVLTDTSAPDSGIVMTPEEVAKENTIKGESTAPMDDSQDTNNGVAIKAFLEDLGEAFDQNVTPKPAQEVVWTAERVSLILTDAYAITLKKMTQEDIMALQKFFVAGGATTGGIGFTFVPPAGTISAGFVLNNSTVKQLMCIMSAVEPDVISVRCGYGPGGGAL